MEGDWIREGKEQIKVGLELIVWSKLACWDANNLKLVANDVESFESYDHLKKDHKKYGRLICWIIFSVGAEYLGKGFCIVNGNTKFIKEGYEIIRTPSPKEDFRRWVELVSEYIRTDREKFSSIQVTDDNFGTLGSIRSIVSKDIKGEYERKMVEACYRYLADSIRNRDVHRYTENRRGFHFHMVEKLFVPAFNIILKSVEQKHTGFCNECKWVNAH